MKVRVYRNLKHGRKAPAMYSIQHQGKVIARANAVLLGDVTFKVNEAGRQRVLREGRKNVHAFAVGVLLASGSDMLPLTERLAYNPYEGPTFVNDEGKPVNYASGVVLNNLGITASGSRFLS